MAKLDLEAFPTSPKAKRMLETITAGFYDKSYVGKWLFQVMGLEFDELSKIVDEFPDQLMPETATWGLMWHEIKWQLPVRENLSYEERRRLIYMKRDFKAPMTPVLMEEYLNKAFPDYTATIADVHDPGPYFWIPPHPNVFAVYLAATDEYDVSTADVRKLIDEIKQSHTTYEYSRVIIVPVDESDVESATVPQVKFMTGIDFWRQGIHNGRYLHDGEILHGEKRAYWLVPALQAMIEIRTQESVEAGTEYTMEVENPEEQIEAQATISGAIQFPEERILGEIAVGAEIETAEEYDNGKVIIMTDDVRHNGARYRNGSFRHRNIYKEVAL